MSRQPKKRNKAYRPKTQQIDPVSWAIAGVHTFPVETQRDVMAVANRGYDKLREGVAKREDWNLVCQALNTAEALCMLHIGDNLRPAINEGHAALHQIAIRILKNGRTACYADELKVIREALDLHAIQLSLCTQAEYSRAIQKVKNLHIGGATLKVAQMYEQMDKEAA